MLYEPINLSMHFTFEKTQTLKVRDSGFILRFATVELSKFVFAFINSQSTLHCIVR
jgi:hypothetical protein